MKEAGEIQRSSKNSSEDEVVQWKSELHWHGPLVNEIAQKTNNKSSVSHEVLSPELSIKLVCNSLTGQETFLSHSPTLPAVLSQPQTSLQARLRSHGIFHIFSTAENWQYSFQWRCGQHDTYLLHPQQMRWWICCRSWPFQGKHKLLCCQCRYPASSTYLSSHLPVKP